MFSLVNNFTQFTCVLNNQSDKWNISRTPDVSMWPFLPYLFPSPAKVATVLPSMMTQLFIANCTV